MAFELRKIHGTGLHLFLAHLEQTPRHCFKYQMPSLTSLPSMSLEPEQYSGKILEALVAFWIPWLYYAAEAFRFATHEGSHPESDKNQC